MRARDLKYYDFLNNVKTNLVKLYLCQKDHILRPQGSGLKKRPNSNLES